MELPVVRPRASLDSERCFLGGVGVVQVVPRQTTEFGLIRYVGKIEEEVPGSGLGELLEELALVDALVPGPEILGVEVDVKLAQAGQGGDAAAEVLPGVILGCHDDATDMWLRFPVGSGEVEFCDYGFHAEADLDISNKPIGVLGQEIPGYNDVRESEGEDLVQPLYGFKVPGVVSAIHGTNGHGLTDRRHEKTKTKTCLCHTGCLTFACRQIEENRARGASHIPA